MSDTRDSAPARALFSRAVGRTVFGDVTPWTPGSTEGGEPPRRRACAVLVLRCALLGVATGSRSSLGLAGPTLLAPARPGTAPPGRFRTAARATALLAVATELVLDKQPGTPARTSPQSLVARLVAAASGAGVLSRRAGADAALPAVAGVAGAVFGSFGGLAWRRSAALPDLPAALVEDAVAVTLAAAACRTGGVPTP